MHAPNLLLGALFATLTITTAAPPPASFVNKTDTHDDIRDCVVPEIALITRFSPFKLRVRVRGALTPFAFTEPGPSSLEEDQPFLSRYVETQSVFRLTDGNLTTADRGFDNFQAFFGSTPEVGQPFLNPLLFSRNGGETRFFGVYSCDESGKYILVLRTDKSNYSLFIFV